MKKIYALILILIMATMLFSGLAMAEAAAQTPALPVTGEVEPAPAAPYPVDQGGAYSWAQLATITGATAAVLLIVQFIKLPIDQVYHIPTRVIVYVIALLVMTGAQAFTAGFKMADFPLIVINAFVVGLAAMGAYEQTFNRAGNG